MSNYEITDIAEQFKALGHPHRLALFRRLTTCCAPGTRCAIDDEGGVSVGELGSGLSIAPSTLSHHLKELNRAGLIQMQRQGKSVVCRVDPATLSALAAFFNLIPTE